MTRNQVLFSKFLFENREAIDKLGKIDIKN